MDRRRLDKDGNRLRRGNGGIAGPRSGSRYVAGARGIAHILLRYARDATNFTFTTARRSVSRDSIGHHDFLFLLYFDETHGAGVEFVESAWLRSACDSRDDRWWGRKDGTEETRSASLPRGRICFPGHGGGMGEELRVR